MPLAPEATAETTPAEADALVEATPESTTEVRRQLRFDGMTIRDHKLAITGLVDLTDDEVKRYKAGAVVTLTVTGTVRKHVHHFRDDKDSGERYIAHQVTVQVGEAELEDE